MINARSLSALALALLTVGACRPREGDRCICEGECAGGLVCAADGAVLREGQCVPAVSNDLESGVCVDAGNVDLGDDALNPPPRFDAGSWATDGDSASTSASTDPSDTESTTNATSPDESSSGSDSSSSSNESTSSSSSSSGGSSSSSSSTGM